MDRKFFLIFKCFCMHVLQLVAWKIINTITHIEASNRYLNICVYLRICKYYSVINEV